MLIEVLLLASYCLALFAAALALSWAVHTVRRRPIAAPPVNTRIRLRQGAAIYVCHFLKPVRGGWSVTAPIRNSTVVPIRPAETFLAEFTTGRGLVRFFTRIVRRESGEPRTLVIQAPSRVSVRERRTGGRVPFAREAVVLVNERFEARLQDIATGGARLRLDRPLTPGEDIRIRPPGSPVAFEGFVLDCRPLECEQADSYLARVRFDTEAPLDFLLRMKEALAG
ncbi:MAG: PilZ domain-containing protein [Armatimonadetes bacterium]|nr:PilZ domain-containing protein [Armatimonadota bacterium]